jgi:hypothetical protein
MNHHNTKKITNKSTMDPINSLSSGFYFICLKILMLPNGENSIIQSDVIVMLSSLSDLSDAFKSSLFNNNSIQGVIKLMNLLKRCQVTVVFCSDSVDDDIIHLVSSSGVTLVSYE